MYKQDDPAINRGICGRCDQRIDMGASNLEVLCTCYFITLDLEWMVAKDHKDWVQYAVTWDDHERRNG